MRLKERIASILSRSEGIRITFLENDDGLASSRRSLLAGNLLSGMFSSLISGVFLTSLILTMMQDAPAVKQNSFLGSVTMISLATGAKRRSSFVSPDRLACGISIPPPG